VQARWADFDVAIAGASAALTGLLFVAVSLRPREIRHAPVMIGRLSNSWQLVISHEADDEGSSSD
jgi:hypothetical protein